ncbi:MAG: DNA replication/repair protein RecF [Ruminococcaceae bacterium]|nr:DNA replication/repair protein RecF [Oscillospiraceae bacterium]
MRVTAFSAMGFRNLTVERCVPDEKVNIFWGDNAQGKTNLLEALWLFTGSRSFRGAKDRELRGFDAAQTALSLNFFGEGREQTADITIERARQVTLNGVALSAPSQMAGRFLGVVFSPAHMQLIKGGPEERRRFLDTAYCPLRPAYTETLLSYQKALRQRNALLKSGCVDSLLLEPWDRELANYGARIIAARRAYIKRLRPAAEEIYRGLSQGKEPFSLEYMCALPQENTAQALYQALQNAHAADMQAGFTSVGPHREDLEVLVDGISAKSFGSQGQQRSAVLAIKLAEARLLQEITGEAPVVLLDDVMSELDPSRQEYILNALSAWQVFITCCDPAPLYRLCSGKAFEMKGGRLTETGV